MATGTGMAAEHWNSQRQKDGGVGDEARAAEQPVGATPKGDCLFDIAGQFRGTVTFERTDRVAVVVFDFRKCLVSSSSKTEPFEGTTGGTSTNDLTPPRVHVNNVDLCAGTALLVLLHLRSKASLDRKFSTLLIISVSTLVAGTKRQRSHH
jgi:hypothetical protein